MKTKMKNLLIVIAVMMTFKLTAQTIAVAPMKSYGIFASSEVLTKITRIELVKLNKYAVMDKYDTDEMIAATEFDSCFGKTCLVEYGKKIGSDYVLSGNVDGLGDKIVVNLKIINVADGLVAKSNSTEFDNQEFELQRMIGIVLNEMHGLPNDPLLVKSLAYKNEVIVSNNVGKINNSGPRMGMAYTVGDLNDFLIRPEDQGGLEIHPIVSNLGYQFEGEYVGTENFSALAECLIMFSGLEQGKFIPSISLLNGYRFGKAGWEFAFGPSFTLSKFQYGFYDNDKLFDEEVKFYREQDAFNLGIDITETNYEYTRHLDTRGDLKLSTRWIMAFGRTFQSGALNIPVNVFYSSQKSGGMLGLSVGFNIVRAKKNINQ